MRTCPEVVLAVWCRLTGHEAVDLGETERLAFFESPQLAELAATPYEALLEAGISAASRGDLPLPGWLRQVQDLRSAQVRASA